MKITHNRKILAKVMSMYYHAAKRLLEVEFGTAQYIKLHDWEFAIYQVIVYGWDGEAGVDG